MTCNDQDCESCNPLSYCEVHDVEHKWYHECWVCLDEEEADD